MKYVSSRSTLALPPFAPIFPPIFQHATDKCMTDKSALGYGVRKCTIQNILIYALLVDIKNNYNYKFFYFFNKNIKSFGHKLYYEIVKSCINIIQTFGKEF